MTRESDAGHINNNDSSIILDHQNLTSDNTTQDFVHFQTPNKEITQHFDTSESQKQQ